MIETNCFFLHKEEVNPIIKEGPNWIAHLKNRCHYGGTSLSCPSMGVALSGATHHPVTAIPQPDSLPISFPIFVEVLLYY